MVVSLLPGWLRASRSDLVELDFSGHRWNVRLDAVLQLGALMPYRFLAAHCTWERGNGWFYPGLVRP